MGGSWITFLFLAPFLVLGLGAIAVGWMAYEARRARERRARVPAATGPDPIHEYARLNREIASRLGDARDALEATRDAVRRGVR